MAQVAAHWKGFQVSESRRACSREEAIAEFRKVRAEYLDVVAEVAANGSPLPRRTIGILASVDRINRSIQGGGS